MPNGTPDNTTDEWKGCLEKFVAVFRGSVNYLGSVASMTQKLPCIGEMAQVCICMKYGHDFFTGHRLHKKRKFHIHQ